MTALDQHFARLAEQERLASRGRIRNFLADAVALIALIVISVGLPVIILASI